MVGQPATHPDNITANMLNVTAGCGNISRTHTTSLSSECQLEILTWSHSEIMSNIEWYARNIVWRGCESQDFNQ